MNTPSISLPEIRPSSVGGEPIPTVNARELHAFLAVGKDFSTWIKAQITRARLVKDRDFVTSEVVPQKGENLQGGRPRTDYHLTLDAGKHVAMVSGTEKGFEVREYFILCERRHLESLKAEEKTLRDRLAKSERSQARRLARPAEPKKITKAQLGELMAAIVKRTYFTEKKKAYYVDRLLIAFKLASLGHLPAARWQDAKAYLEDVLFLDDMPIQWHNLAEDARQRQQAAAAQAAWEAEEAARAPQLPEPAPSSLPVPATDAFAKAMLAGRRVLLTFYANGGFAADAVPDNAHVMTVGDYEAHLAKVGYALVPQSLLADVEAIKNMVSLFAANPPAEAEEEPCMVRVHFDRLKDALRQRGLEIVPAELMERLQAGASIASFADYAAKRGGKP